MMNWYVLISVAVFGVCVAVASFFARRRIKEGMDDLEAIHLALKFTFFSAIGSIVWPISVGIGACILCGVKAADCVNKLQKEQQP